MGKNGFSLIIKMVKLDLGQFYMPTQSIRYSLSLLLKYKKIQKITIKL